MEESEKKLSKRERRELRKEQEREQQRQKQNKSNVFKWGIIGGVIILLGLGGWFLLQGSSKPLPAEVVKDLGREHIPKEKWETYKYNSNPPTSGPHDVQWTKAGVYDSPEGDGYLVHSLEHGYIIVSYNCMKLNSKLKTQNSKLIGNVYAHGTEEEHAKEATPSGTLEEKIWNSKDCQDLKNKLADIAKKKRLWKLIVIARPILDSKIALTAWTRIEKINDIDEEKISQFVDAFRDKGPEKTME